MDLDIYEHLKAKSTFEDTFNSVLRRELGVASHEDELDKRDAGDTGEEIPRRPPGRQQAAPGRRKGKKAKRRRAAAGTLLPEKEYNRPILEILAENGGRLPKQAVIDEVGRRLNDRLTDADRDTLESGGIRWQSRAQFARLRLAERGLIDKNAPRGVWAITTEGEKTLKEGV